MAAAPTEALPVFETPAGRLGVLICADAWYPEPYDRLRLQDVNLIAVPSYIATQGAWKNRWRGYDGAAAPPDVDPDDIGRLTEAEAWRKYALPGRIDRSGAKAGINVFLGGCLWELGGEGQSIMVSADHDAVRADNAGPALLNLWL